MSQAYRKRQRSQFRSRIPFAKKISSFWNIPPLQEAFIFFLHFIEIHSFYKVFMESRRVNMRLRAFKTKTCKAVSGQKQHVRTVYTCIHRGSTPRILDLDTKWCVSSETLFSNTYNLCCRHSLRTKPRENNYRMKIGEVLPSSVQYRETHFACYPEFKYTLTVRNAVYSV